MTDSAKEFWKFSIRIYKVPGIEHACLDLQDTHGLDVNLVLFCCWAGSLGYALEDQDMKDIAKSTKQWQIRVVQPLRAIRRDMKGMVQGDEHKQSLRSIVKKAELTAEKLQQQMMMDLFTGRQTGPSGSDIARTNLKAYGKTTSCTSVIKDLIAPIISASFSDD